MKKLQMKKDSLRICMQYRQINPTLTTDNILLGKKHQESLWQVQFLALQKKLSTREMTDHWTFV